MADGNVHLQREPHGTPGLGDGRGPRNGLGAVARAGLRLAARHGHGHSLRHHPRLLLARVPAVHRREGGRGWSGGGGGQGLLCDPLAAKKRR